jgi:acetate kinase
MPAVRPRSARSTSFRLTGSITIDASGSRILTINSGSSSVKFALYRMTGSEQLQLHGLIERIGVGHGLFHAEDEAGRTLTEDQLPLPDHDAALQALLGWLGSHEGGCTVDAVGHRVVHGGAKHSQPERVTPELMAALRELIPLAPDHLPHEIKAIEAVERHYPASQQVACFDTAFHRQMPELAQVYALPRGPEFRDVIRYGFHGLSCEYIMGELRAEAGDETADGRVIVAHLGNGASIIALRGGRSVDTTMGFTPTGGLVMSTRSGDLDPSVVLYLIEEKGLSPADVRDLLNHRSGLLGLSGQTSDMRDLLEREATDARAALAVALFCYQATKFLGALAAALGGLDTLIFTGGIGENAAAIRRRICEKVGFLGLRLDPDRNDASAPIISRDDSPVSARVMKTDEELMIARHTYRVVRELRRP